MKKYSIHTLFFLIGLLFYSCAEDRPELGTLPTSEDITFTYAPSAENANILVFTNTTEGAFFAKWDLGNGASGSGNTATGAYAMKGDYEVTLTVATEGGHASMTQTVSIDQTDLTLLDREDYNNLTGGSDALDGKTWVFDKDTKGHMGIGPADSFEPIWWVADAMQKNERGAYDDEMTFKLIGFDYKLVNNGDTYAKSYMQSYFEGLGGTVAKDDDDITMNVTLPDQTDWAWSLYDMEEDLNGDGENDKYLSFSNGAFPSWHTGGNQVYQVLTLTEDEMMLRTIGDDGNAWYYGFIRKGFVREVEEPVVKEVEENDIFDDFAGNSNVVFTTDGEMEFTVGAANFDPHGNEATSVGKYVRTSVGGDWWQNYQTELPFKMDLSQRNIFTMKVYMLASNDYTTPSTAEETPGWLGEVNMTPTIALRLENSEHGGNSWQSRAESLYTFGEDELGKWVEVTFDFSQMTANIDMDGVQVPVTQAQGYDKIIIQIGNEGHIKAGTFYISDFKLLPAQD